MSEQAKWAIGIDGGGTKSTACLMSGEGILHARTEVGATNYNKEAALKIVGEIGNAVDQLLRKAKKTTHKPDVLAACLSGLGREDAREHIKQLLTEKDIAHQVFAESDAMAALYGAFAGRAGIMVIAGTGSVAFGKSQAGEIFRCGGWGYLLGDEGSGFDIGRNGINAALKDCDARGPSTSLRKRFEQHFQVQAIDQAVTTIYANNATRGALAQFAPVVFEEAAKGDIVAQEILNSAAGELAQLVLTIARKMEITGQISVALMGKIFQNTIITKNLKKHLLDAQTKTKLVRSIFPADIGAALLGLESIGVRLARENEKTLAENIEAFSK
ncbi:MAG: N-acetylglucosamine kinase [bacterium]